MIGEDRKVVCGLVVEYMKNRPSCPSSVILACTLTAHIITHHHSTSSPIIITHHHSSAPIITHQHTSSPITYTVVVQTHGVVRKRAQVADTEDGPDEENVQVEVGEGEPVVVEAHVVLVCGGVRVRVEWGERR